MSAPAGIASLRRRWRGHLAMIGAAPDGSAAGLFDGLIAAYSEPQRHYHTFAHLEALFTLLERHAVDAAEPARLAFAAWYHDVVYDPRAKDNEERSARRARAELAWLGLSEDLAARITRLIRATADHAAGGSDRDDALFLDADMAILGAAEAEYDRYARDVRAEYGHLDDAAWAKGRGAFLNAARARQRLFHTDTFEFAYAAQARANLSRELAALSQRDP